MVGLSPSPPETPTEPSSSKMRAQSVPLSSSVMSMSSFSPRKGQATHQLHRSTPRAPQPSNRFGLRDSDTSDSSEEDTNTEGNSGSEPEASSSTPKRVLARSSGPTGNNGHDTPLRKKLSQRWSVGPGSRGSPSPSLESGRPQRTREEEREQEEFIQAVRLRRRRDPVQEYDEAARKEAWRVAQEVSMNEWAAISALMASSSDRASTRIAELNRRQTDEVQRALQQLSIVQAQEEDRLRVMHRNQDADLRNSIEESIALYEAEIRAAEEAERLAREAQERAEREAAEAAEAEARIAEQAAREAEQRAKLLEQQRKEAEEKKAQAEEEKQRAIEKKKKEAAQKQRDEEAAIRNPSSFTFTRPPEWELQAYQELQRKIKIGALTQVKATKLNPDFVPDPQTKKMINSGRRLFTQKIGQLTNTRESVNRVVSEIQAVLTPNPDDRNRNMAIEYALQHILCKTIIRQAEVEVTAKPSTAFPLAKVVMRLVELHPTGLESIFMYNLVKRTGPWVIAWVPPMKQGMTNETYRRECWGYKPATSDETSTQYIDRMVGLLTLYGALLQTSPSPEFMAQTQNNPALHYATFAASTVVPGVLLLPRLWTWTARMCNSAELMSHPGAAHILAAVIGTAGNLGMAVYGAQFQKMMICLMEKCEKPELPGGDESPIGGKEGGEGKAGRVRLLLMLQDWQKDGKLNMEGRDFVG
ncbi:hypothetical protein DL93DRAFT_2157777 [Clavulina sp. PMI_390]|nr:hypothetical protein DL93DRAFT_2157777 [Clavulina sp. PMI_390]